jgi:hypothetical protein
MGVGPALLLQKSGLFPTDTRDPIFQDQEEHDMSYSNTGLKTDYRKEGVEARDQFSRLENMVGGS